MFRALAFILSLLLLPLTVYGVVIVVQGSPASVAGGGGGGDSCTGNLLFSWHMESTNVTAGTPAGCSVSTSTTGTLFSLASITSAQVKDGTYSLEFPTSNDYASFTVNAQDIIKHDAGTIDTWVYITANDDSNTIMVSRATTTVNSFIKIAGRVISTFNQFQIQHKGSGGSTRTGQTSFAAGFSLNTWYHIIAKWDTSIHGADYLYMCADTTTGTSNCGGSGTALEATATAHNELDIGSLGGTTYGYIDLLKIYSTWQ